MKKKRREALAKIKMKEYRQLSLEMSQLEHQIASEVSEKVFEFFNISQECFQESFKMANLPENQEKFQRLQQAIANSMMPKQ